MKYLDTVEVINDRKEYAEEGVFKGMIGRISDAEIRDGYFHVCFIDERWHDKEFTSHEENFDLMKDDIFCPIKIKDLKFIEDGHCPDEWILEAIPNHSPRWWCKYEDGYVYNLACDKMKLEDMKTFLG